MAARVVHYKSGTDIDKNGGLMNRLPKSSKIFRVFKNIFIGIYIILFVARSVEWAFLHPN
jgi:hypothetical protein